MRINFITKSLLYPCNIFIATMFCWYTLKLFGMENPIWSVITVVLVSDPDISVAMRLSKVRIINTIVGCVVGLTSLIIFGYSGWISFLTAAVTVLIITSIEQYPANWRLAPVTILIIMDASRDAKDYHTELMLALARASEIGLGCIVAMSIAYVINRFVKP